MLKTLKQMLMRVFMTQEMQWRHRERRLHKFYAPLLDKAKGDEREMLHQELGSELWELDRERSEDRDSKLIKKARRYDIPIPRKVEKDELWQELDQGFWLLTDQGVYHLKKAIQEEQKQELVLRKAKLDLIVGWTPLITGLEASSVR